MSKHVLVVEDEADLAEALQVILESSGFEVEIARNGAEALRAIEGRMPALIILDMLMPIMNGWEFAAEFERRHGHATNILVVTAADNPRQRADEIGADAVLPKPFDIKTLLARVHEFVNAPVHAG
ncbi:MAG: response regulator transcription factor [Kofleriaceae bacterium]|nr:response regulator transcription factor [Kofleriaceae bacterium]